MRKLLMLMALVIWAGAAAGQQDSAAPATAPDRSATGGATTLEDILARQRGAKADMGYRANNTGAGRTGAPTTAPLGTLGGISDSEIYRALRFNSANVTASARGPAAAVLIQDRGMWWLEFRRGPLATYGVWLLGGTLALLTLFYLIRGRIRIDGPKTGRTILRFSAFERFGHWLLAGSFILLALTGLITLFARTALIPLLGHQAVSTLALASKWVHNNVAWAFMAGLAIIIVNWTLHNIPNRHDLKWLALAGGLFSRNVHPPARKFNAGQKLIFWGVVVLGLSVSASGLSLLFPFELPMFAKTFAFLNDLGAPGWIGRDPLPETLAPHEEMQFAQIWHSIIAFVLMAIILAHVYIGSVGMEGAFDAMGSGLVEEQWAREHHGLWVDEVKTKEAAKAPGGATPAE